MRSARLRSFLDRYRATIRLQASGLSAGSIIATVENHPVLR